MLEETRSLIRQVAAAAPAGTAKGVKPAGGTPEAVPQQDTGVSVPAPVNMSTGGTLGKQTVGPVTVGTMVELSGTTVHGDVITGTGLDLKNGAVVHGDLRPGTGLSVQGSTVDGSVHGTGKFDHAVIGGDIHDDNKRAGVHLTRSSVGGTVEVGGQIEANACPKLGTLTSRLEGVALRNCPSVANVQCRGGALVEDSSIQGDVIATDGAALIKNSQIDGLLYVGFGTPELENATVGRVVVEGPTPTDLGGSLGGFLLAEAGKPTYIAASERPQQMYMSGGVVRGDVTFKGGNGELILDKGAQVLGKVSGGKIITR